jgi:hypothetical protein
MLTFRIKLSGDRLMRAIISLTTLLASFACSFAVTVIPPANDNFADAFVLRENAVGFHATFLGSTLEPGEPKPVTNPDPVSSIWWTFIPSETRPYSISAFVDSWLPYAIVKVYRGDQLPTLIPLQNHAPITPQNHTYFTFRATAGELVRIQVLHRSIDAKGVTIYARSGPSNDDFQNALPITNNIINGTTAGATSEFGEAYTQTVWYKWQPDRTRGYEFPAAHIHSLFVFEGSALSNLKLLGHTKATSLESFTATILADASKSYYIAVSGLSVFSGAFEFHINPGPDNDMFMHRTLIQNLDEYLSADLTLATREPEEPSHTTNQPSRTLWYEWIAPTTGGHYIETTNLSPRVAIYTGDNLTNLTAVPVTMMQKSEVGQTTNFFAFHAIESGHYHIAIHDDAAGTFSFRIRSGPPNDDFANAIPIILNQEITETMVGASLEPGEPQQPQLDSRYQSVWHRFVAPSNHTYVALSRGNSPGAISVFRGTSLSNLVLATPIATNLLSSYAVPFYATNGETLFISVTEAASQAYGLEIVLGAENDAFASRINVTAASFIQNAAFSTREPEEPQHTTNPFPATLWWKWIPDHDGLYRISAPIPNVGSALALYSGTILSELTLLAAAEFPLPGEDEPFSYGSFLDFQATAGVEYAIAFSHHFQGAFPITLQIHKPPQFDNFASPLFLSLDETLTNEFGIATRDLNESWTTSSETIWYQWTAPATRSYAFVARPMGVLNFLPQTLGVFIGDDVANLTTVARIDPSLGAIAFRAIAGQTYQIGLAIAASPDTYIVRATITKGPPSDDFASAAELFGSFVFWTNTTMGATSEPGENLLEPGSHTASVWAKWTAPVTGEFRVFGNAPLSVYTGTSLSSLRLLGRSDSFGTSFFAEADHIYFLRIASPPDLMTPFSVWLGPGSPSDTPAGATELTGTNTSATGWNWSARHSRIGKSAVSPWFKWTAPSHGFLSYSVDQNAPAETVILAFHNKTPTMSSNILNLSQAHSFPDSATRSNTTVVTKGITYYFAFKAPPSTNLGLNLQFEELPISLPSGALIGGKQFWSLQTNVVYSGSDALTAGSLASSGPAWIETTFPPGRLIFRAKMEGDYSSLLVIGLPNAYGYDTLLALGSPQAWTKRHSIYLQRAFSIRWIFQGTSKTNNPARIWLDDFEFIPATPILAPFQISRHETEMLSLSLFLKENQSATLDVSTNLVDWLPWTPWTNIYSEFPSSHSIPIPISTNDTLHFFRARITP